MNRATYSRLVLAEGVEEGGLRPRPEFSCPLSGVPHYGHEGPKPCPDGAQSR